MRYVCSICGYVYNEEQEGTPFAELPETWTCPLCGAPKALFEPEAAPAQGAPGTPAPAADATAAGAAADATDSADAPAYNAANVDPDLLEIPSGVLAAIFSNLARGCEKQYHDEEAGLFREIADHFTKKAVAEQPAEQAGLDELSRLLTADLAQGYPALNATATDAGDRGTLRICVWGEKVTRVLASLVDRYRREGEAFLEGKRIWVCSVCGFTFVSPEPPALCPVCKVPAWKFDEIDGRAVA